ncbi:hypothetical protein M427DRAFT_426557 [Gonapodya prolifera JEL478]|uniref:Exocyst complex component Sec8 n=1 Tax=Gonapodya prolifera (strain JEL478) TaxID=1344416 RepID=A0A139A4C7_GONPJ|nr:hypothetical protein M427DRAFT_426557 [Gonapodya prolifera JEL478]|eukprot:KXS11677.1 hypothetical protein M427DRAFT_426557 [Gonapodya prolifera JEL478]
MYRRLGSRVLVERKDTRNGFDTGENDGPMDPYVERIYSEITQKWDFMMPQDFNSVLTALSLLDNSSLGRDYDSFTAMLQRLEKAMDILVNDHFQAFNTSVHTFSGVVDNVVESQKRIDEMKMHMEQCRHLLQCKRNDLLDLWTREVQYKDMLQIIDVIDDLRKTPDRLENLVSGKYFLNATRLLLNSIKTLEHQHYTNIGALVDLRQALNSLRNTLHETLIEELNRHIYLKSPFSADRLPTQSDNSPLGNVGEMQGRVGKDGRIRRPGTTLQVSKGTKSTDSEERHEVFEDLDVNPELDSYHYIEVLVECLRLLGKIPETIDVIRQRLPLELYDLVERTTTEVRKRHDVAVDRKPRGTSSFLLEIPDIIGLDSETAEADALKDFLSSLYQRLEIIVHGHLFLIEVIRDAMHNGGKPTPYEIHEVWTAIQNEVKSLLYDYFTSQQEGKSFRGGGLFSVNDVVRDTKSSKERSTKHPIFRVLESSGDTSVSMAYQDVAAKFATLRDDSVEISKSRNTLAVADKFASRKEPSGHQLLIRPDPRRVLVAFRPTIQFMERIAGLVLLKSQEGSDFRVFLDDFILNVFLPKQEDTILQFFQDFINGEDAFGVELNTELSMFPLIKSAIALVVLVQGLCRTLHKIPVHREEFVNMIEMILAKYHDKCQAKFRALMSTESTTGEQVDQMAILSAVWAQDTGLVEILSQNSNFLNTEEDDAAANESLSERELTLEMKLKKERSIHRSELVFDHKKLWAVANLHYSMEWFSKQIQKLRLRDDDGEQPDKGAPGASSESLVRTDGIDGAGYVLSRWWSQESLILPATFYEVTNVVLPLDDETSIRFDALLLKYQKLAETCLFALRIEFRCHSMYYLDLALREGNYFLEEEAQDPDPYVSALNSDLVRGEEIIAAALPSRRVRFIFDGLAKLMTHVLISDFRYIRKLNKNGLMKLTRNVHALQQNLSNISSTFEAELARPLLFLEAVNRDV